MSGTMRLTDDVIRAALTPAADVMAPAGLADSIRDTVELTPQRRAGVLGWAPSPRTRLALQLAAVGLLLLGLLLGALLVGSRPTRPMSVLTYHGGPERTGIMPGPGPKDAPSATWSQQANGPFGAWSPAVVGGTVYDADESGSVSALDETSGMQAWQWNANAPINSGVTLADGQLIVGDDVGILHVIDAATGKPAWQFQATGPIHGPAAVVDGVAYFGTTDGHLYALDLGARRLRWPAVTTPGSISRAIAVGNAIVYASSGGPTPADGGTLSAYDATNGRPLWSQSLDPGNTSTPTVADGRVFVASGLDEATGDRRVFAFDARTGAPAWPAPFKAPSDGTLLLGAVAGGRVYATGTDGTLYILDASTGERLGEAPIGSRLSPNAGIVGHTLYVTSDDRQVYAFDVTGPGPGELWRVPVTGTPSAPTIVDGAIFLGTSSGIVVRLSDADGTTPTAASP